MSIVVYARAEYKNAAKSLADSLKLELVSEKSEGARLELDEDGLSLVGDGLTLRGDFGKMIKRIKPNNLSSELVVKAARLKNTDFPTALDATAGLGEDSFLLAAAGFNVRLYEYNPIIAALLADALLRARDNPELCEIASKMTLVSGDSIEAMKSLEASPDVVLLDPMFPKRQKSALVKKKLQLIQSLEHPCDDEEELFLAAKAAKPKKIIIKRPKNGEYLAGIKPSYSIERKSIRYDCVVL